MPEVPSYGPPRLVDRPAVSQSALLMAAAVMHEQGRLFEPQTEAQDRKEGLKDVIDSMDFHNKPLPKELQEMNKDQENNLISKRQEQDI